MGDKKKEINYSEDAPIEEQLVSILKSLKKTITTAESITGGLISAAITSVTAKEMAIGAMMESEADIAVAITGNAGPTALEGKEVGLIYIAVCAGGKTKVEEFHFGGNRKEVREQACGAALVMVRDYLLDKK